MTVWNNIRVSGPFAGMVSLFVVAISWMSYLTLNHPDQILRYIFAAATLVLVGISSYSLLIGTGVYDRTSGFMRENSITKPQDVSEKIREATDQSKQMERDD